MKTGPTAVADTPSDAGGSSRTESDLERVLRNYPLGQLTDACRVNQGLITESWSAVTSRGRFFVKRRHPSYCDAGVIRAQHELMEHLRLNGFPAPALMKTLKNENTLELDGQWYEIQEFIDGIPYDHYRPAHLEQAALTLGLWHKDVEGFARPVLRTLGDLYAPATAHQALVRLQNVWWLGKHPLLSELVERLSAEARRLAARFAYYGALPRLVIHGNYYGRNLIFDGDRIVGVVNYDRARWVARVADLSEALIYFASARGTETQQTVCPGLLQWGALYSFLKRYGETPALTQEEVRAIPDFINAIWLSWSLRRLYEEGIQRHSATEALQEVASLVDWTVANAEDIIGAASCTVRRPYTEPTIKRPGEPKVKRRMKHRPQLTLIH